MSEQAQTSPGFDNLRSALKYGFDAVQQETDPFRRLAWLIERQETFLQQRGRESPLPQILGLQNATALLEDCESVLRNHQELHCDPDFPRRLIQEGMAAKIRQAFIDILGELERQEDDYGIDFNDNQNLDEIEYWLGFRQAALTVKRPVNGLTTALNDLDQARSKLGDPGLNRGDVLGKVTDAFVWGETLLRQLLSFYGRVFYGSDYIDAILRQYDREATEKAQLMAGVTSLPELSDELGELLALTDAERPMIVRAFLEDLLRRTRKAKFPAAEAGKLRDWQEKGKGLGFLGYIQVLHSLDRWVVRACESPQTNEERVCGQNFDWVFQRKRLFPSQAEAGQTVDVPVKERNRIEVQTVPIEEKDASPFVEILRGLNRVRPLYVHEADSDFVHPSNLPNMRDGAQKILDTFINLWTRIQRMIFPPIVVVRRLLQIDANLVRLDYVPESGPSLRCIRVAVADLPHYVSQLLGQEAYLYIRDRQGSMISALALYPVDEQLIEEEVQ
jgi:hypothetical protein